MKRILTIALVIGALALGGFWLWRTFAGPAVTVAEARTGRAVEAVYATAVVEPVYWGRVGTVAVGRISAISAKEGDAVKKGDELARMDDDAARAHIRELRARRDQLRADVARIKPLAEKGFASQQSLERSESDLKQTRAALAAARSALDDLILRAPLDGVVLRRDGEIGETVGPENALFWVGKPRPLRAEADVDEEDIPRVRVGQNVLIKADAFPGRTLAGTVAEITPKGDPVTKSYRVRVALPEDTPLLIGMTVETNIVVNVNEAAVLVPAAALADGDAIWVVRDGRAQRTPVTIGAKDGAQIEVRDGVPAGARVIISPPKGLKDGTPVRVNGAG